jgi:hypothetical protein
MDMSLPVMDGWEATRRIKSDGDTRNVLVIGVCGVETTAPPPAASPQVSIAVEGHECGALLRRNIVEGRSTARRKCGDDSDDCEGSIDGAHHARPLLDHRLLRVRQIKTLEIDGTRHRISPVLRGLR